MNFEQTRSVFLSIISPGPGPAAYLQGLLDRAGQIRADTGRSLRPATAVPGILRRSCVSLVTALPRSRRLRAQHDLERLLGRTQQEIESPGVLAQREAMGNHGPHVDFA